MRYLFTIIVILSIALLSSCEKHDDEYFSTQKCEVRIDGKNYIEQPKLGSAILGPVPTPSFTWCSDSHLDENGVYVEGLHEWFKFKTFCASKRGAKWEIAIEVSIFGIGSDDFEGKTIQFSYDNSLNNIDYNQHIDYCVTHEINYAIINFREKITLVNSGNFTISRMTKDAGTLHFCDGFFEFNFEIEGETYTAKGEFKSVPFIY